MVYMSEDEECSPEYIDEEDRLKMLTDLTELDCNEWDEDKYNEQQFGKLELNKYNELMKPDNPEHDDIAIATVQAALAAVGGENGITASELSRVISDLSNTWFDLPRLASLLLPGDRSDPETLLHHHMFMDIVECVDGNRYRLKRSTNNEQLIAATENSDMAEKIRGLKKRKKTEEKHAIQKKNNWLDDSDDMGNASYDEEATSYIPSDVDIEQEEDVISSSSRENSTSNVQTDNELSNATCEVKPERYTEKIASCDIISSSEGSFQLLSKPTSSGSNESTKDDARPRSSGVSASEDVPHAKKNTKRVPPTMRNTIVREDIFTDDESVSSVEQNDGNVSDDEASSPPVEAVQEKRVSPPEEKKDPIHQDLIDMQRDANRPKKDENSPPPFHRKPSPVAQPSRAYFRAPSPPIILSRAPSNLVAKKLQHVPGMVHPLAQVVKDREAQECREKKKQMDQEREKKRQEQLAAELYRQEEERKLKQLKADEEFARKMERMDLEKAKEEAKEKPKNRFDRGGWNPQSGSSAFESFNQKGISSDRQFGQGERKFGTSPSPKGFDQHAPPRKNRFNKSPSFNKSSHAAQMKEKSDWFNRPAQQPRTITPEIVRPVPTYMSPMEPKGPGMPQSSSAHGFGDLDFGRRDQYRGAEAHSRQSPAFSSGFQEPEKNTRNDFRYDQYSNTGVQGTKYPESNHGEYGRSDNRYDSRNTMPRREPEAPYRAPSSAYGSQSRDKFNDQRQPEHLYMHQDRRPVGKYGRNEDTYDRRSASTYVNQSMNQFFDQRQPVPDRQSFRGPESNFGGYRDNEEMFGSRSSVSRSVYEQPSAPSSVYSNQPRNVRHEQPRFEPVPIRQEPAPVRVVPTSQPPKHTLADFIKAYMILYAGQGSEIQWTAIQERCKRLNAKFHFNSPSEAYGTQFADHLKLALNPLIHVLPIGPEETIFAFNDAVYTGWETFSSDVQALFVTVVYDLVQGFDGKTGIKWSLLSEGLQLPTPESIFGQNWPVEFTRVANEMQMPIKAVKSIYDAWLTLV